MGHDAPPPNMRPDVRPDVRNADRLASALRDNLRKRKQRANTVEVIAEKTKEMPDTASKAAEKKAD